MKKKTSILVVDDVPAILQAYSEILRVAGYEVWEASTGQQGLQAARERRPDLLLLDVMLPDLSGMEVCRQIKADAALTDVFVVLVSGTATSVAHKVDGLGTGADDYLVKPLDVAEFLARVRTIVRLRDTTAALRASEQRYRALVEIMPDAVGLVDPQGRILAVNPRADALLGYTSQTESPQKSVFDLTRPEDHARLRADIATVLKTGSLRDVEYMMVGKDGHCFPADLRGAVATGAHGQAAGIVVVVRDITERKRAEAALREREQLSQKILGTAMDGFWMASLDGKLLQVNEAYCRMSGYSREELLSLRISDLEVNEPTPVEVAQHIQRIVRAGTDRFESRHRCKDGRVMDVEVSVNYLELGKRYCFAFVRDITDRKRAEEKMAMLAHAVESTSEPICITDLQDRFIFVNRAFQNTYGYTEAETLGKTPEIIVSSRNPRSSLAEVLAQTRCGGWRGEVLDVRKDGTEFPVSLSTSQVVDRAGRVIGLMGVAQDITERKRAEERIQLLADAVQSTQELICITDEENRFTFANQAFLQTYGYTAEELMGRTPDLLYSARNPRGLCEQVFQQTLQGGWQGEIVNRRKDGTEFPISLSTSQIRNAEGNTIGLIGVAQDISERKQTEKQTCAFSQLGHRLSAATAPEQAAQIIMDIASDLFGWDAGYVHLYSESENQLIPVLTVDTMDGQRSPVQPTSFTLDPSPLMRLIMQEGAQLINRDNEVRLGLRLVPFGDTSRRSASMMYVPIRSGSTIIGILSVQSYTPRAYSQNDLGLLQGLADHCGDALERIKMAEALRKAEAQYRSIFENATEGIFQTTAEGRYRSANPALARMLGYQTPAELVGSVTDIERQIYVKPQRRRELKRLLETQGSVRGFEFEHYRKDGSIIWVSVNAHVLCDAPGAAQFYEGTIQDVTQRKLAEVVLVESEEKFRTLFESAPIGTALHDANGHYLKTNSAYQQMLGYTGEELRQLGAKRITYPDDIAQAQQFFAELRDGKRDHYRREKRYVAKDGHLVWAQSSVSAVRDGAGRLRYIVSMVENITERKQTQEALERAQREQKAILSNIPDPAWLKDTAGRFLACNEALARLYRQPPEAILGRTVSEFVPELANALIRQDEEVVKLRRSLLTEVPLTDPQGRLRWFEDIKSPVFDEKGEVIATVGIARDITDRRWAESLLRRQRDFGIFLSSTDDLGAAAGRLLKLALENEGLDCGAVYLVNSETNTLELAADQGLSAGFAKRAAGFAADALPNRVAGARQAASGEQVQPMAVIVQQLKREGLLALEAIPIQHSGQVVAVLNVGSLVRREIPGETRHVIEALAAQAGGAIARIRAEQSMRTSQQMLEKTIHSLRAAVFIVDAHRTTIQECNPTATRVFGYSRQEMIGQSPALLHLNEATREEFRRRLEAAVKEKGLLSEFEFRMKRKDGTSFPSQHTLVPIRNKAGQIVNWVGVVRDITERKRTEEGLRQLSGRIIEAQEAERQRVARDLHDSVNQVIASAKMRLRKVQACVAPNPMAEELLARCDELLVQALDENRRIAHDLRPTDLDALGLVDACRNFCRQFQARTNLVVKTRFARFARRCPPAMELNLFRIVQEALNNVGKYARARTVRVQIAFQRGSLMLRIRDDGRGFDPNAVKPAGRKAGGIGLTNIRERAAILGGTSELVSVPNEGTTITVRVPCQDHRSTGPLTTDR